MRRYLQKILIVMAFFVLCGALIYQLETSIDATEEGYVENYHIINQQQFQPSMEQVYLKIPSRYLEETAPLRVGKIEGEKINVITSEIRDGSVYFEVNEEGTYALVWLLATNIQIETMPERMIFSSNEERDFSGLTLKVFLEDGSTYITDQFEIGETKMISITSDSVEIIYENCSTFLDIEVGPISCFIFQGELARVLSFICLIAVGFSVIKRKP